MLKFVIVVFTLFCRVSFPVKHSLKFMFTGLSGVPNIPEFVGVVKVDEAEMVYCDSNVEKPQPKQDWQKVFSDKNTELLKLYTHCQKRQHFFRENIHTQTGGVHTFQRMYGCEWDDETDEDVKRFDQFRYDGDFVASDQKPETWTNDNQQNMDNENTHIKNFLTRACFGWLTMYLGYGRSFLQRTELPSVSLLQKTSSSPVTCLATGFYPDRADLFWRKDERKLHEDKNNDLILPNHDGTFQWSVVLKLSSIKPKDWRRYDCVFRLSGVTNNIITKLDKTAIKTNRDYNICKTPDETETHITVAVLVLSIFLFAFLIIIVISILTDSNGDQRQPPNNHLIFSSTAAVVAALILVILNGILVHKNSEDLHNSRPSDFAPKWSEPPPEKLLNL